MNRNTEQHFTNVPKVHARRSKFNMSHSIKTTFNNGSCIPIFCDADILPGDTVEMDMAEIVRMATPIYPVMDNLFLDLYWFFVPHRLVWEHWQAFWGENDDPWTQTTEYEIPQITVPVGGFAEGTIADYIGIPTYAGGVEGKQKTVNALPFRAYAKIWNDFFRDENLQYNCHIYTDETTRTGVNTGNQVTDTELGGLPCKGAKMHDYFTSALPSPQKGPAVSIPLGTTAPTLTGDKINYTTGQKVTPLRWGYGTNTEGHIPEEYTTNYVEELRTTRGQQAGLGIYGKWEAGGGGFKKEFSNTGILSDGNGNPILEDTLNTYDMSFIPINLYTDLSQATAATISQLRTAFAVQKYYEQIGRTGSRYIEFLRGVFGVESSDARLQRAEYIGGKRIPINIDQILQTSSTDAVTPQGNAAGFSCTRSHDSMFTHSFEEHGTLMCIALVRTEHTYQQGLEKQFFRKKWLDFYNPFFANLSEQNVYSKELFFGTDDDDTTFGYQEAWAEYRYKQNRVSGMMRSNSPNGSLDAWHYADDYEVRPTLSDSWIQEPTENVDRTLAVQSGTAHQFIADFYLKCAYVRNMPVYSIPGLIDHV